MDLPQLKRLAARLRAVLEASSHTVGHSQSLDLIAAVPGLRNWPEAIALLDRVHAARLDAAAIQRLAHRLQRVLAFSAEPGWLTEQLSGVVAPPAAPMLDLWPSGPPAGVYITTSAEALARLVEDYEAATDGALLYRDGASIDSPCAVDLGETGLWSMGLSRAPSGTLIIMGPLALAEESWRDGGERLAMACLHAQASGHRVGVLIDTPDPTHAADDVHLLVQTHGSDDEASALMGVVTNAGAMEPRQPFAHGWGRPSRPRLSSTSAPWPGRVAKPLARAIANRRRGHLVFGSSAIKGPWAANLIAAALVLTDDAGPAARIRASSRATRDDDRWPDAAAVLPELPSIEAALARGYRRLVISPIHTRNEVLAWAAERALLISGHYAGDVANAYFSLWRDAGAPDSRSLLAQTVAVVTATEVQQPAEPIQIFDGCIVPPISDAPHGLDEQAAWMERHRIVRWENEASEAIKARLLSLAAFRRALPRQFPVSRLAQMGKP